MKRKTMKQLNKIQSIIFLVGGLLMVVGACCFAIMWQQDIVSWVYLVGALLFAVIQIDNDSCRRFVCSGWIAHDR